MFVLIGLVKSWLKVYINADVNTIEYLRYMDGCILFKRPWNHKMTRTERLKKLRLSLISEWILASWDFRSNNPVARKFFKCCISNKLDGNEGVAVSADKDNNFPSEVNI